MATLSISTLDYFDLNNFSFTDSWQIPHGSKAVLYFMLTKADSIGTRRFIPPVGTVVKINFMRQRTVNQITPGGTQAQTVSKIATVVDVKDSSIFSFTLSSQETATIISGGVQLVLDTAGDVSSYSVPYVVKKTMTGAGC
jgi:hypothetical protein